MAIALVEDKITSVDNLDLLIDILPPHIREALFQESGVDSLIEIVLDLGREPEARYPDRATYLQDIIVAREDLQYAAHRVGHFTRDNRAGIERTLHRISAIRNRLGEIVGLTCRVGRAIFGTVDIIRDLVESGQSILLMGRPGVGKTTLLREAARVLADDFQKRVIVVDTSNEIAGDGDIPHPSIGRARRMQVSTPDAQHDVMIEAVENHMPEVIVIDEIGTEQEALAARTIAERGVQLIATVHGNTLENLMSNPSLSDLVGGIQPVTLSDEEARRRGTQKTVLERKAPPTFDVLVEIQQRDRLVVHRNVAAAVDELLRGRIPRTELRQRRSPGDVMITETAPVPLAPSDRTTHRNRHDESDRGGRNFNSSVRTRRLRIFPYAISRERLAQAIEEAGVPVEITSDIESADILLTLRPHARRLSKRVRNSRGRHPIIQVVRSNTTEQIENFLQAQFAESSSEGFNDKETALRQVEDAIIEVMDTNQAVELPPQPRHIRRLQHLYVERSGLGSESVGVEPFRRINISPR